MLDFGNHIYDLSSVPYVEVTFGHIFPRNDSHNLIFAQMLSKENQSDNWHLIAPNKDLPNE